MADLKIGDIVLLEYSLTTHIVRITSIDGIASNGNIKLIGNNLWINWKSRNKISKVKSNKWGIFYMYKSFEKLTQEQMEDVVMTWLI